MPLFRKSSPGHHPFDSPFDSVAFFDLSASIFSQLFSNGIVRRLLPENAATMWLEKGSGMPRTPNYNFERKERDRIKAAKKAEKLAAKAAKRPPDQAEAPTEPDASSEKQ
jgi:hypothetical protein